MKEDFNGVYKMELMRALVQDLPLFREISDNNKNLPNCEIKLLSIGELESFYIYEETVKHEDAFTDTPGKIRRGLNVYLYHRNRDIIEMNADEVFRMRATDKIPLNYLPAGNPLWIEGENGQINSYLLKSVREKDCIVCSRDGTEKCFPRGTEVFFSKPQKFIIQEQKSLELLGEIKKSIPPELRNDHRVSHCLEWCKSPDGNEQVIGIRELHKVLRAKMTGAGLETVHNLLDQYSISLDMEPEKWKSGKTKDFSPIEKNPIVNQSKSKKTSTQKEGPLFRQETFRIVQKTKVVDIKLRNGFEAHTILLDKSNSRTLMITQADKKGNCDEFKEGQMVTAIFHKDNMIQQDGFPFFSRALKATEVKPATLVEIKAFKQGKGICNTNGMKI